MTMLTFAGLSAAAALAFANGANDISKSIATLVGSGETDYKRAVILTSLAVASGAVLAAVWAVKMTLLFTNGMLTAQAQVTQLFALSVLAGAIGWVLFATRSGLPVSTTHAIVGSVIFTAVCAFGSNSVAWAGVAKKVLLPLFLSPVLALGLAYALFKALFWICREKYCLNCHWAHWLSAMSSGFARGLNDTPKIAALGLVFYFLAGSAQVAPGWFFLVLAAANALGGIVMGFKVTDTLAHKMVKFDHLEGLTANLATSVLTICAAVHGVPVSTTHVSSSAILGMGLRNGTGAVNWKVAGEILAAWLITLPAAGIIGAASYWALKLVL